jgi:hypothetical protein
MYAVRRAEAGAGVGAKERYQSFLENDGRTLQGQGQGQGKGQGKGQGQGQAAQAVDTREDYFQTLQASVQERSGFLQAMGNGTTFVTPL